MGFTQKVPVPSYLIALVVGGWCTPAVPIKHPFDILYLCLSVVMANDVKHIFALLNSQTYRFNNPLVFDCIYSCFYRRREC